MLPAEFESAIPASKQRQTNALNRAATGIGEMQQNSIPFMKYTQIIHLISSHHVK